jgi:hypothetical protein
MAPNPRTPAFYEEHLAQCWTEGFQQGRKPLKEIQALGYTGCFFYLARFPARWRQKPPTTPGDLCDHGTDCEGRTAGGCEDLLINTSFLIPHQYVGRSRPWCRNLHIVRPDTVIAWHRGVLAWYWTRKSRRRPGRPNVSAEIRGLIRNMSQANPLWGAPRIHGELNRGRSDRISQKRARIIRS